MWFEHVSLSCECISMNWAAAIAYGSSSLKVQGTYINAYNPIIDACFPNIKCNRGVHVKG